VICIDMLQGDWKNILSLANEIFKKTENRKQPSIQCIFFRLSPPSGFNILVKFPYK